MFKRPQFNSNTNIKSFLKLFENFVYCQILFQGNGTESNWICERSPVITNVIGKKILVPIELLAIEI